MPWGGVLHNWLEGNRISLNFWTITEVNIDPKISTLAVNWISVDHYFESGAMWKLCYRAGVLKLWPPDFWGALWAVALHAKFGMQYGALSWPNWGGSAGPSSSYELTLCHSSRWGSQKVEHYWNWVLDLWWGAPEKGGRGVCIEG